MEKTNENILEYNGNRYYLLEVVSLERIESKIESDCIGCPFKACFSAVEGASNPICLTGILWDESMGNTKPILVCKDVADTIIQAFATRSPVFIGISKNGRSVISALCFSDVMFKHTGK